MKRDDEKNLVEEDLEDEEFDDEDLEEYDEFEGLIGLRGFAAGLVIGALLGAGVALLIAPERGEVVRKRITRGIREIHDEARDQLGDWRGEARRELGKQRRKIKRQLRRVRSR
ncbi:MAG: YtxH domain-containing protein [Gemmatimonadota bacterium]|nr:MAG: YtxH domain-containing protein [Gemmatimonadota bacterium]